MCVGEKYILWGQTPLSLFLSACANENLWPLITARKALQKIGERRWQKFGSERIWARKKPNFGILGRYINILRQTIILSCHLLGRSSS